MNLDQFYNSVIGKAKDFDGAYGAQCVDLNNFYQRDVVGGAWVGTPITGGARDWWENYERSAVAQASYIKIDRNAKPQDGDVPVWGSSVGGGYGHIGIIYKGRLLNQNNNGRMYVTLDNMFTSGLLGYLRPRKFITSNSGGNTDMAKITDAEKYMIRVMSSEVKGWDRTAVHRGDFDAREMAFWKGQNVDVYSQQAWNEGAGYRELKDKHASFYNQYANAIAELGARPTKAELEAVQAKLEAAAKQVTDATYAADAAERKAQALAKQNEELAAVAAADAAAGDSLLRRIGQFISKYLPGGK